VLENDANANVGPVMRQLSEYMADAASAPLPRAVADKAKHHVLDTLGAMITGAELTPGRRAIAFAESLGGREEACVPGSGLVTSAMYAALANGMTAHADETDDSHSPGFWHPGCAVVPAALAMAERHGRGGRALLNAVVLGYDVGSRVTMTLGAREFSQRGHKSSHTVGANFGAHAACGALSGFDAAHMRWLLAYAAQQASGTYAWQRDVAHIQKAFDFGGMGARNGVCSALMVAAGCTGVNDVFSGKHNYFQAFAPDADPAGMARELGETYEIMNASIKKWAVGSPIQASLDSLQALILEHDLAPEDITAIRSRVGSAEAHIVDNREMPDICLQHCLALMVLERTASFHALHDYERMRDPAVLRERAKVTLIADDELGRALPRRQAIVEVDTTDGRTLTHRTDDVRGTADNPMSRSEVEDKARDLLVPTLGAARADELIAAVWSLENVDDVRELRPLLMV
jgi:2-methylcitrate dehydratase PrpD